VDTAELGTLVNSRASNVFIGYGTNHNPELLHTLGECPNAAYFFIDQIEKTGLVLGEIFHGIFYKCYTGLTLQGTNCLLYDFRTNSWLSTIHVDAWTSDTNKTYHFRSTGGAAEIVITGHDVQTGGDGPLATVNLNSAQPSNLQQYVFRQRTQEIMYQAAHNQTDQDMSLKLGLTSLLEEIQTYMNTNGLDQDPFYLSLCDDLVITLRTYGTRHGHMFALGRINSNGHERTYNICALPPQGHLPQSRRIGRTASPRVGVDACDHESKNASASASASKDEYMLRTDPVNMARLTPSMSRVMRSASQIIS
jgi:hypothetical protein